VRERRADASASVTVITPIRHGASDSARRSTCTELQGESQRRDDRTSSAQRGPSSPRRSMPPQPAPPPLTQRSSSGPQVKMTARRWTNLDYVIRGSVDVGDSVVDRSGPHEMDAISPQQRGEHIDDIVVIVHHKARQTRQFTDFARRPMRPARKHHPDPCERLRGASIGMTRPFEDLSTAAARARRRPSVASCSRNASTVLSMNVSTSTPSNSASSSAATSIRGRTQRAHRREFSYPINSNRRAARGPLSSAL
jgi:hypothetical protein